MSGKTVTLKRKQSGRFLENLLNSFKKRLKPFKFSISPTLMSETKKPLTRSGRKNISFF